MTAGKSAKKDGAAAGSPAVAGPGGSEGAEVAEERVEVVTYAAAIDVAKGSGMVCTRVPHPSRPGQRRTRVWDVDATTNAILELGEHLAGEGIEKVTLESTSDYWRIWFYLLEAAGFETWLVNAKGQVVTRLPRPPDRQREPPTRARCELLSSSQTSSAGGGTPETIATSVPRRHTRKHLETKHFCETIEGGVSSAGVGSGQFPGRSGRFRVQAATVSGRRMP